MHQRTCSREGCNRPFDVSTGRGRPRKYCSSACNRTSSRDNKGRECSSLDCHLPVRALGLCSNCWKRAARASGRLKDEPWDDRRRANAEKRRARKFGVGYEDFERSEVFARDNWMCGLCSEPVDPDITWPDPLSPSLDHVLPLSLGGAHSRANTQCSHLGCNVAKGNRVPA